MNRRFEQQHDRILIHEIRENRAHRAAWCFHIAIAVMGLCFIAGSLVKMP